ncbi:uncharacterized protein LOC123557673 [Mercenaria mercenaria]|uniref:uncharacterized protein LOC123557673 n=1 Tax=Mercenaria mercenaria TaxID=6596 RepID=UPI00234F2127|nr:uncharacterized protein LOC123557673 [Mercenaria mercenaria]
MTFLFLLVAFIFFCVRYLWRKNDPRPRPLDTLDEAVVKWRSNRMDIIEKLREAANLLRSSHRHKAETEQTSAKKSLVGDLIGIGGVLLAPFSGGLSLVAAGASVLTSVDSYFSDKAANKEHEENATKIKGMKFKKLRN